MSAAPPLTLSSGDQRRLEEVQRLPSRGPASVEELRALLAEPSWVVRRAVVASLVRIGASVVPLLCDVLATNRANETVVAAAVETLVAASGEVESSLLALARQTSDLAVLCDVVQILGRRKSPESLPTLAAYSAHEDDNLAVAAIEALGRIGGAETVPPLVRALESGNFFRAFPAIATLGQTGDPRAIPPLAKLLRVALYRAEAAAALGRTGERAAVAPLIASIRPGDPPFTRTLARALLELHGRVATRYGDERAVPMAVRDHALAARMDPAWLADAAQGGEPLERLAVASLLAWLGDESGVRTLLALLDSDPRTAGASFNAIRGLRSEIEGPVREALKEAGSGRRALLLPLVAGRRSAVREIALCLEDPDPAVRTQAADALGHIGDPEVVPALFDRLGDADARVAQAVLGAVQSLGSDETKRHALAAVKSTDPRSRRAALRIVAYFGYAEGLEPLLAAANDDDERIRDAAIAGLALSDDPRALGTLLDRAQRPDAAGRAVAFRALGGTANLPEVVTVLERGLADPDAWARYYACQALGRLHVTGAAEALARRLEDSAGQVRVAAVDALAEIGGDQALAWLARAAESTDEDVRRAAVLGLGAIRRPDALPILLHAALSPDAATRLVALSALADQSSSEGTLALMRARSDEDLRVREAAWSLLSQRRGAIVTAWLVDQLATEAHRERALVALAGSVDKRVEDLLMALDAADAERAGWLVKALLHSKRPAGKAAAELALQLGNVHARRAAAKGLAELGPASANAALEQARVHDPDPEVRRLSANGD